MKLQHIVKSQQFDKTFLDEILDLSKELKTNPRNNILKDKILATIFYEPSTRTRLSFESAMIRMGGNVITTENARDFSSAIKGENIIDTIKVISSYSDIIAIRHYENDIAEKITKYSSVPIINAGDGNGQHPTQSLIDIFTIKEELGQIDDIVIAMVGDLYNGRTIRSLSYLLSKYKNVFIYFVSPSELKVKDDIKDYLNRKNVKFKETNDILSIINQIDVLYQTRIQKERFSNDDDYQKVKCQFIIDEFVIDEMKNKSIIMHPLPRLDEISVNIDDDIRSVYFKQASNGIPVRSAILKYLL